jgi:DUF4097 and DUF4098 domain-containing protein YvlB
MRTNRTLTVLTVSLAALAMASAAIAETRYTETETFSQTYSFAATGRVSLDNINGDVRVEVWDANEVRVEAVKKASSLEYLKELKIEVNADSSFLEIETDYPSSDGWGDWGKRDSGKVEYTVTIPRTAEIDSIDLVNGDLTIEGAEGGIRAETVNGSIELAKVAGEVEASTVNGTLRVRLTRLDQLDTVDLQSVNGRIDLGLPSSAPASVRAETVNGKISNEFGLEVNKHKYVGADLTGDLNGGGVRINLSTVNGSIELNRS